MNKLGNREREYEQCIKIFNCQSSSEEEMKKRFNIEKINYVAQKSSVYVAKIHILMVNKKYFTSSIFSLQFFRTKENVWFRNIN